ncbi:hypothetical protein WCX49_11855 [Sulfurimonas sp. HSL-1656]|uniref:hypothetical protein n=1 Tax=Thiomicrolovo subterrani TaxID=3131934 RepID=UPI0031F769AE
MKLLSFFIPKETYKVLAEHAGNEGKEVEEFIGECAVDFASVLQSSEDNPHSKLIDLLKSVESDKPG